VENTHGVTLPPDRVVVTPEMRALLLRLAELGDLFFVVHVGS